MDEYKISAFFRGLKRHGIQISAHKLRHSYATNMARFGDIQLLQHSLGHTNISTTIVYVSTDISALRGLQNKIEVPNTEKYLA